ncbi:MAG: hypothetical protein PHP44_10115 [Kiritimatiellae bacterium]|nr:hypothetical protein [Kiritimatiellia bacterium]
MKSASQRPGRRNQLRSTEERSRLIELYKLSGLKPSAFCRDQGIHLSTFCGWLSRARTSCTKKTSRRNTVCFVEAAVTAAAGSPANGVAALEVVLPTGTVIRFRDAASAAQVGNWPKEVLSC